MKKAQSESTHFIITPEYPKVSIKGGIFDSSTGKFQRQGREGRHEGWFGVTNRPKTVLAW